MHNRLHLETGDSCDTEKQQCGMQKELTCHYIQIDSGLWNFSFLEEKDAQTILQEGTQKSFLDFKD